MPRKNNNGTVENVHSISHLRRLAIGYTRVSTHSQGAKGISLEAQRAGIEEYCNQLHYTLIEVFSDVASGVGAGSYQNRRNLQLALQLARQEEADLIVWDWDRLSRHAEFERQILKHVPDRERVICAKRGMDMREAAKHSVFADSEYKAKEISRRTREAMAKMRAQGVVFGNPNILTTTQPLGSLARSTKSDALDFEIADVLREVPDPVSVTYREAADLLNEKGVRTLHGNEWNKSRIRNPMQRALQILRDEKERQQDSTLRFGMF